MSGKTLSELSDLMAKIDFCMLETRTEGGRIAARPMSNNGEVAYRGQSWFFTWDGARMARDIGSDERVGLTFQGSGGVLGLAGKPGPMIAIQGRGSLIRDRAAFAEHWTPDLDRWFENGIETDGMVMIRVDADRITYWNGEDQGEVTP